MPFTTKHLFNRLFLIVECYLISLFILFVHIILLPIRLYRRRTTTVEPAPPPHVSLTIHEPSDPTDKHPILLIHGFPDCSDLFEPQVTALTAQGYRCFVAGLPGAYGERVDVAVPFQDMPKLIMDAVRAVYDGPLTVVGHDWGAFYASLLVTAHPDAFERAVMLDVGHLGAEDPINLLTIMAYQAMLALVYMLGHPAGTLGVKMFLTISGYNVRPMKEITADMCYPYVSMVKFLVKDGGIRTKDESSAQTKEQLAKIPHLYVYGRKKIVTFHNDKWVEFVKSTPEGTVMGMPCGHWINVENAEEFNLLLTQWLEKTEKGLKGNDTALEEQCNADAVEEKGEEKPEPGTAETGA